MTARAYLSNISRLWPLDRQEELHAERTPGWPGVVTVYQDQLGPTLRRNHAPSSLVQRGDMLRPTSRRPADEVIYVASLAVLAWEPEDFMGALAAAARRHAAIVVLDTGRRIEPTAGAPELTEALKEFRSARRREQTSEARKAAALAREERRREAILTRIELIRPDWPNREPPTEELLLRAGYRRKGERKVTPMHYQTAIKYLGYRTRAQRNHEASMKRAEARRTQAP